MGQQLERQFQAGQPALTGSQQVQLGRLLSKAARLYDESTRSSLSNRAVSERRKRSKQATLKALKIDPASGEAFNLLARISLDEGLPDLSLDLINRALENAPENAGYWYSLGHVYLAQGALSEAEQAFEHSHRLDPSAFRTYTSYAYTKLEQGEVVTAFQTYRKLARIDPKDAHVRAKLFECLRHIRADFDNPGLADDLYRYLAWEDVNPNDLGPVIVSLLQHRYRLQEAEAEVDISALSQDTLLIAALKRLYFCDPKVETLLTAVRRYLLLASLEQGHIPPEQHSLMAALGLHSAHNEYIFAVDPTEHRLVDQIDAAIGQLVKSVSWPTEEVAELLLLFSMYRDPARHPCATQLTQPVLEQWPQGLQHWIEQLLVSPDRRIDRPHSIQRLGTTTNAVSRAVREQYEEHPYPRWLALDYHTPTDYKDALRRSLPGFQPPLAVRQQPLRVLIAGCGTGRHALHVARYFRNVEVVALDISLQSLRYAETMAHKYQLGNIRFIQGDILRLDELDQKFQVIECSGVLHHMQDPLAGWAQLRSVLVPQGLMKIGLYSERARREVTRCRQLIREQGLQPSEADIRQFRQQLLSDETGQFRRITSSPDFYSMSGCRDLLFHVQEHLFTPLRIQQACRDLNLSFLGFVRTPAGVAERFRERYPDDPHRTDLENWEAFEIDHPDTFAGMYQFFCQRTD